MLAQPPVRLTVLAALAALLAGGLALELRDPSGPADTREQPLPAAVIPDVAARPGRPAPVAEWQAAMLDRPLFSPARRPPAPAVVAAAPAAVALPLPRLTGVLIDGAVRRAIFAGPAGKPLLVQEGAVIAGMTVRDIRPGQVTLEGAQGMRTVRPSFDAMAPIPVNPAIFAAVPSVASLRAGNPGPPQISAR